MIKTIKFYAGLVVGMSLLFALLFGIFATVYRKENLHRAFSLTAVIQEYIQNNFTTVNLLNGELPQLADLADCRISILAKDGTILCDSARNDVTLNSFIYHQEVLEAKKGTPAASISSSHGIMMISTASAPFHLGKSIIILHLEIPLHSWKTVERIRAIGWFTIAFFALLMFIPPLFFNINSAAPSLNNIVRPNFNPEIEHFANERIGLLSTLFNGLKEGMILFDLSGGIQMINPQAKQMMGVRNEIFFKDTWDTCQLNPLGNMLLQEVKQTIESKTSTQFDMETEAGQIIEISVSLIKNKYQPFETCGVLALLRDVTDLKRMEQQRSEFVSNVSHELRTPLTLISGFVETLQGWDSIPKDDRLNALEIISVETQRLERLISQLLRLSHIDHQMNTDNRGRINAIAVITTALSPLKIMAENKNQQFVSSVPTGDAYILGHEAWLIQIIYNLCENAIKYTPEKGHIELTVNVANSNLVIAIKDDGIGIPEKDQKRIFERFYRVDKARNSRIPGSGLGLALTKDIVGELSGQISLTSEVGKGSEFIVTLPLDMLNGKATEKIP
jgi:two-component system phosphate regulon sensor histidine kinase PhoR